MDPVEAAELHRGHTSSSPSMEVSELDLDAHLAGCTIYIIHCRILRQLSQL